MGKEIPMFGLLLFGDRVSLSCNSGWHVSLYMDQADPRLTEICFIWPLPSAGIKDMSLLSWCLIVKATLGPFFKKMG